MLKVTEVTARSCDTIKPRLYVWPKGENIMENLQNRRSRPYVAYKEEVIPQVQEWLDEHYRFDATIVKASWSQRAGCPCGCSPGFVLDVRGVLMNDLHVSVTHEEDGQVIPFPARTGPAGRPRNVRAMADKKLRAIINDPHADRELVARAREEAVARFTRQAAS